MEQSAWFAARDVSNHFNMGSPAYARALVVKHCYFIVVVAEMRELCRFVSFHGFCVSLALNLLASVALSTRKLSLNTLEINCQF
jgi:hypothetical protein